MLATNCPENFETRVALVGAEIARIEGRDLDAMRLYEQAIRFARENGFIQIEGVANEVAARFHLARGFERIAYAYLREARYCCLCWEAAGKVRQLDQLYPQLGDKESGAPRDGTIGASVEQLDLTTVIKVSQTVSGEIVLEKLIDTLMRTDIEHAGAERGRVNSFARRRAADRGRSCDQWRFYHRAFRRSAGPHPPQRKRRGRVNGRG